jgi:hypothetical protein
MIPVETLRLAQETAVRAAGVEVKEIPGDPENILVSQGDKYEVRAIPPGRIAHVVLSLDDLVAYARRCEESDAEENPTPRSVWHNAEQVVLLLDDEDRRDRVTFALQPSEAFETLSKLQGPDKGWMPQAAFVRLLKIDFGVSPAIVAAFRVLDFKRGDASHGDVQHARETLGKSVEAAVQGTAAIPEDLMISIPLYRTAGETAIQHVRCAVEINPVQGLFKLTPLPQELDAVVQAHQADLHERLQKQLPECGVFYGTPGRQKTE